MNECNSLMNLSVFRKGNLKNKQEYYWPEICQKGNNSLLQLEVYTDICKLWTHCNHTQKKGLPRVENGDNYYWFVRPTHSPVDQDFFGSL